MTFSASALGGSYKVNKSEVWNMPGFLIKESIARIMSFNFGYIKKKIWGYTKMMTELNETGKLLMLNIFKVEINLVLPFVLIINY